MTTSTVVTGLGVAAPNGLGLDDYWKSTLGGHSGLGRITRFTPDSYPSRLAGEISGFEAAEHLPGRLLPQTDRMTQIALAAADWAISDAGVDVEEMPAFGMGVITASSSGGFEFGQNELAKLWAQGSDHVSAYQSFAWFYAVNSGQISIRHGMKGPSGVVVSDQAGGLDSLAQARRQIHKGTRLVVSGAVDASICPWGWVAQETSGRLSRSEDPDAAYLPFDRRAAGHVAGEGGAIVILEPAESARERGARVYGEIAGYAATVDPPPGSGREPGLGRAILGALEDAGADPADVDAVFADAAAIPDLDRVEADVINTVFGTGAVPVTAPKTMVGRLYSGAAPLDVATALLAMRDGVLPPTVNTEPDRDYGLDLVGPRPRTATVRHALVVARGYGGFNSAMLLRSE